MMAFFARLLSLIVHSFWISGYDAGHEGEENNGTFQQVMASCETIMMAFSDERRCWQFDP